MGKCCIVNCTSGYKSNKETVFKFFFSNIQFKYTCSVHIVDVTTEIIVYYIQMRMRQYSYQETLKLKKFPEKKKYQNYITINNILY